MSIESQPQPKQINYSLLNLLEEQSVMHAEDIWNPHFLTPADHAQMMDRQYGKGDGVAYLATPSPSISLENVENPLTPPSNANAIEEPRA